MAATVRGASTVLVDIDCAVEVDILFFFDAKVCDSDSDRMEDSGTVATGDRMENETRETQDKIKWSALHGRKRPTLTAEIQCKKSACRQVNQPWSQPPAYGRIMTCFQG